jgi:glycosyltransferase involved in cell wall biosynthesis
MPLKKDDTKDLFFSIIIPVRNEAENIQNLLNDIAQQSFPAQQFEVIIVDDASTDQTVKLIRASQYSYTLKLFSLKVPEGFFGSHKKLAITQAIDKTLNTQYQHIILTTDGDCRVENGWLQAYADIFATQSLKLVSGPVTFYHEKTLFEQLQTIEFSSLIGTGAASIQAGSPNMCNGANLAFTKTVFENVNGYMGNMHQPSGDDEFLMRKIFQQYSKEIAFLKDQRAIVHTYAQKSLRAFYQQRRRWAGKWQAHNDVKAMALAIFIFIFYVSLFVFFLLTITGGYNWKIFLLQIGIKVFCELFFLGSVLQFLKKPVHIGRFLLVQIIYPYYVIFFGIAAHRGYYSWKGRQYK